MTYINWAKPPDIMNLFDRERTLEEEDMEH